MKELVYYNELFDLYGDLLTEKQKNYFKDYYFDNLSYGEIGDKYHISRNAIFHQLKLIIEKLNNYEEKLQLYKKKQIIENIIELETNQEKKNKLKELL